MDQVTITAEAHGRHIDNRIGAPLEYEAKYEPETFAGPMVDLYTGYSRETVFFPAEDLDAVIAVLSELRSKMQAGE